MRRRTHHATRREANKEDKGGQMKGTSQRPGHTVSHQGGHSFKASRTATVVNCSGSKGTGCKRDKPLYMATKEDAEAMKLRDKAKGHKSQSHKPAPNKLKHSYYTPPIKKPQSNCGTRHGCSHASRAFPRTGLFLCLANGSIPTPNGMVSSWKHGTTSKRRRIGEFQT